MAWIVAGIMPRSFWRALARFRTILGPTVDQANVVGNRAFLTRRRPGHPLFYGPGVDLGSPWIELSAPPRPPIPGHPTNSKRASERMWVGPARRYSPDFTICNSPRPHPLAPNRRQQAPDR